MQLVPDIASLVAPLSLDAFMQEDWQSRTVHIEGPCARLEKLRQSLGDFSVAGLLHLNQDVIVISGPIDNPDQTETTTDIEVALNAYHCNRSLSFNLDPTTPKVAPWYDGITAALGPEPNRSTISVFCTPPGHGTAMHFDRYDVFNVALSGTKTWRVSREPVVEAPLHDHQVGLEIDPALQSYGNPSCSEFQTIHMTPGDVMYLPRGALHETHAHDEATVGLSFVIDVHSAFEMLNQALRSLMLRQPDLRQSMNGLWHEDRAAAAKAHLQSCINQLGQLVASMSPEDFGPRPELSDAAVFHKSPLGTRTEDLAQRELVLGRADEDNVAHIAAQDAAIVDFIDTRATPFSAKDLYEAVPAYPSEALFEVLDALVGVGYLRHHKAPTLR